MKFFLDNLVTQVNTFITDIDPGAGNQFLDLLLAFAAEGALEQITALANTCHGGAPFTLVATRRQITQRGSGLPRPYPVRAVLARHRRALNSKVGL
ncbi:unannotated protein [freshwater metagenome]|uniref:Unannotated protein n=1 Tax=freshwater metagenome TaxID=449393 RepID=A0A6J7PE41_9ZZZZ